MVVALLVAVDIAVSGYLANCTIRRAGDGGCRNVEEVVTEAKGAEARIEAERAAQAKKTVGSPNAVPGELVEIAAADGIRLFGIIYEHDSSDGAPAATSSQFSSVSSVPTSVNSQKLSTLNAYVPTNLQASSVIIDSATIEPAQLDEASPSATVAFADNRWALAIHGYCSAN